MYKHLIKGCTLLAGLLGLFALCSCIKNDIPYPRIHANFLKLEVTGQIGTSEINASTKNITIQLADTVNLKQVRVLSYQITDSAVMAPEMPARLDLTSPKKFVLSIYQDYEWTIQATQEIKRLFELVGQKGEAKINFDNKVVSCYVPEGTDLTSMRVSKLQLGPPNATYSPSNAQPLDFSQPRVFTVRYHDIVEEWTVYVSYTTGGVELSSVDSWVSRAYLHGSGIEGLDNGFEYRLADSESWVKMAAADITASGGSFVGELKGLAPRTNYVARAYSGADYSDEVPFTTREALLLNNGSFDEWNKVGKVWNPWSETGASFWDTGNKGATTLGESNSYPTDETANGQGKAAKLETRFVGIGSIGKLAAGNLFAGQYIRTDGTNGVLGFGRPFTSYPTALRINYKYNSAPINYADSEHTNLKGQPDRCHIYVALTDWAAPLEIRTKPSERQLFDINDPGIIAYGTFESDQTSTTYQEKIIKLDYRATNRVPTHLVVVSTASKLGDLFTGGSGSILWVDDYELIYE